MADREILVDLSQVDFDHPIATLDEIRRYNPQRFEMVFRKLLPHFKEYRALRERRPDLADSVLADIQAEERLRELSRNYADAKDDAGKQASISKEMEQLVRSQIDNRQKRFEARLQEFADRIKEQQLELEMMKDRVQTMEARKDDIVNRRVTAIKSGRFGEGLMMMDRMGPGMMDRPHRPPPGGRPPLPGDRPPPLPDDDEVDSPPPGAPPPPPPEGGGPPPSDEGDEFE